VSQPITVIENSTTPLVKILPSENGTEVVISIQQLQEINLDGIVVQSVDLINVLFYAINNSGGDQSVENWSYNATLENGAGLEVLIYLFQNPGSIEFAGKLLSFGANTLKYSFLISSWPFLSVQNSLVVLFNPIDTPYSQATDSCDGVTTSNDKSGNLVWLEVDVGGLILWVQILDIALIDGIPKYIQCKVDNKTSVRLILPHFWENATVDPDYNLLLGDATTINGPCKVTPPLSLNVILIVALSCAGLVMLIIAAGGVMYIAKFKLQRKQTVRRLRALSKNPLIASKS